MNSNQTDVERLLSYLEGSLEPGEITGIETRLKADQPFADLLVVLSRNESVMNEWAASARQSMRLEADSISPSESRSIFSRIARPRLLLGAGTLLLIAAALAFYLNQPDRIPDEEPTPQHWVAKIEDLQGEAYVMRDGQSVQLEPGQEFTSGQQLRTGEGGTLVVRLPDSTRVEMSSETVVTLPDMGTSRRKPPKSMVIESGMVRAEVPAQPKGKPMVFQTPHATIQADGTKFSSTSGGTETRVESESGQVKMTRTSDGKSIDIKEGRFAVTTPKKSDMAPEASPPRITLARETIPFTAGPPLLALMPLKGETLAIGTWDASLMLRNLQTGIVTGPIRDMTKRIRSMVFSADGTLLATATDDKLIRIRNAVTGEERITLKKQKTEIDALAFSPDGKTLITSQGKLNNRCELKIWDVMSGLEKLPLNGHTDTITGLAFDSLGRRLFSTSKDGTLRVWDLEKNLLLNTLEAHPEGVLALAISPNGKLLATGGKEGKVKLWNCETLELLSTLDAHPRETSCLAFSPNSQFLASAGAEPIIRLWELETGKVVKLFQAHKSKVNSVTFSPDGLTLISSGWDRNVKIWTLN